MNEFKDLIAKYNEGLADPFEVQQIEKLIEDGKVEFTELRDLIRLDEGIDKISEPSVSQELDSRFYRMLVEQKKPQNKFSFSWSWIPESIFSKLLIAYYK